MKYAYFPGCKIAHHLPQYGMSVEAVCDALGIELVPLEFSCCGWPVRHESLEASVYSAVRSFALAAETGLPILTPCKCCFGNLRQAMHKMGEDNALASQMTGLLAQEGLPSPEKTDAFHLLTVLDRHVGAETIRKRATHPLTGLRVACHYGCHALRPGTMTGFDDPLAPTIFERIMEAAGAETVNWDLRLECCGHPLRGRDDTISKSLMRKKMENAEQAGAKAVVTACTYCQLQFDIERSRHAPVDPVFKAPPAVLATQLLGLAFGMEPKELGLEKNAFPFSMDRF